MTKKLIALLGLAVLFAPNADAARDTRRSQRGVRNVNISGTTTSKDFKYSIILFTFSSEDHHWPFLSI